MKTNSGLNELANHLLTTLRVARDEQQVRRDTSALECGEYLKQDALLTGPSGRAKYNRQVGRKAEFGTQRLLLGNRQNNRLDVELEVAGDPHRRLLESKRAKASRIFIRDRQNLSDAAKERGNRPPDGPHPPKTPVAYPSVDADDLGAPDPSLREVFRPTLPLSEDKKVRRQRGPDSRRDRPTIQWKVATRDGYVRVPLLGHRSARARGASEHDLDCRLPGQRLKQWPDRQQLADAHRLHPNAANARSPRWNPRRIADSLRKIRTIPTATPHPPKIARREKQQDRKKKKAIDPKEHFNPGQVRETRRLPHTNPRSQSILPNVRAAATPSHSRVSPCSLRLSA